MRYFASLAERAGAVAESVELPAGTDVDGLWRILADRHPSLGALPQRPMAACDMTYSEGSRVLDGVREVAFLPPVSGG